jgi:hypothetical protein
MAEQYSIVCVCVCELAEQYSIVCVCVCELPLVIVSIDYIAEFNV